LLLQRQDVPGQSLHQPTLFPIAGTQEPESIQACERDVGSSM
jgi:hypothetical protein